MSFQIPRATVALGCFVALAGLVSCGNPPYPKGSVDQLFDGASAPTIKQQVLQGQVINTARVQADPKRVPASSNTMLLFIHGSPGDWKAWSYYLKTPNLAGFSSRVAVDRPGFGDSGAGKVMTDLRLQAALLTQLIPAGQKAIVVGHSLGGPLAAWMAVDAPDKVCGAVSIAGSLSSQFEEPRWYNRLADSVLLGWAVPKELVESNQEMMPLSGELLKLESAIGKLHTPLMVIQGANDPRVIKPESDEIVDAIKKKNGVVEYVVFDNEGHGFTKKANEIRGNKAILDFLDKYLKRSGPTASN